MTELNPGSLRAFVAIIDHGGFTRAAAILNRTQSGVSMQIKRLEEALGSPVFSDRKRAVMTPAGERLIGHARRLIALHDETMARARGLDVAGHVRIGTPDDYVASLLPSVLRRLANTHPQVEVEVHCALSVDLIQLVNQGRLDLAIITRPPDLEGGVTVRKEPLLWVSASPELAQARPLPLAMFSPGCMFRDSVRQSLKEARIPWRTAYQSVSLGSLLAAVSEGLAIAVLARNSVPAGLLALGEKHGLPPLQEIGIAVFTKSGGMTAAARTVRSSVVEALTFGLARRKHRADSMGTTDCRVD